MSAGCFGPVAVVAIAGVFWNPAVALVRLRLQRSSPSTQTAVTVSQGITYAALSAYGILVFHCESSVRSWGQGAWGILTAALMLVAGVPIFSSIPAVRRLPRSMAGRAANLAMWTSGFPMLAFLGALIAFLAGLQPSQPAFLLLTVGALGFGVGFLFLRPAGRFLGTSGSAGSAKDSLLATAFLLPLWIALAVAGAFWLGILLATIYFLHSLYLSGVVGALEAAS